MRQAMGEVWGGSLPHAVLPVTNATEPECHELAGSLLSATSAGKLIGLSLAPNPAHATATLQLPPVPGATQATLTITDALGRVVRTATRRLVVQ